MRRDQIRQLKFQLPYLYFIWKIFKQAFQDNSSSFPFAQGGIFYEAKEKCQ